MAVQAAQLAGTSRWATRRLRRLRQVRHHLVQPGFRDPVLQAQLEDEVWENMRPGAVAMCANLEAPPPGWIVIDQDMDHVCRGVWQKRG